MRVLRVVLLVLVSANLSWAQSLTERGDQELLAYRWTDFSTLPGLADNEMPTVPPAGAQNIYEFKKKSVAKAFFYSLVIPGAGQFYTGSKLKGFIFLGVEALGWAGYISYQNSGDDKTEEYEAFARAHWYDQAYWDSLKVYRNIDKWEDDQVFPHHLPWKINENGDTVVNLNHEYYENIGKYDQFVWGWDDLQQIESPVNSTTPELSFRSSRRLEYVDMREQANSDYDKARTFGILVIANHVISAFEAAFSAKRFNSRAQHAGPLDVKVNVVNLENVPTPWVRVAYRF